MTVYRAITYRTDRPQCEPETIILFEASSHEAARPRIATIASALWQCSPSVVGYYNCQDEGDLCDDSGLDPLMGDAALLVTGWYLGPVFAPVERTVVAGSPELVARIARARRETYPMVAQQRSAAAKADADNAARAFASRLRADAREQTVGGIL